MAKEIKKVYNVPEWSKKHPYIVVNVIDGTRWYWGTFDDLNRATEVARELKGEVLSEWEGISF